MRWIIQSLALATGAEQRVAPGASARRGSKTITSSSRNFSPRRCRGPRSASSRRRTRPPGSRPRTRGTRADGPRCGRPCGFRLGSSGMPLGTAQEASTPSRSRRRSQCRRRAWCSWTTKRAALGPALGRGHRLGRRREVALLLVLAEAFRLRHPPEYPRGCRAPPRGSALPAVEPGARVEVPATLEAHVGAPFLPAAPIRQALEHLARATALRARARATVHARERFGSARLAAQPGRSRASLALHARSIRGLGSRGRR